MVDFPFPDLDGIPVSPSDDEFKGKTAHGTDHGKLVPELCG